ncbi:hypothetical protein OKW79_004489 [Salmonella enterica]|nr:hypothetical protein [Salmonella enterica]
MKIVSKWKAIAVQKNNWTPEMDALLGQDEDRATANRLYREFPSMRWISTKLVQERRKALGIEGCGRNRSKTTGSKRRQPTVVTPPWTPEEDAILGTDSLAKVSVRLSRPTSQIQKRMKELGIAHFGQRGTPRSSVRLQAEEAQKERNKIKFIQRMRKGAVIAEGVADGCTYTSLAKELGISPTTARIQFFAFMRVAKHPSMLGEAIPRDFKNIPPHVLKKAVCCVENYCLALILEKVEVE